MSHGLPPRIGPYETLEPLAEGGMARVVVARRPGMGDFEHRVALKLIRPELSDDPQYTTMFLDEARINSRVRHRHVVQVLDVGRDPGTHILYMAMELVLGATLSRVITQARVPTRLALEVLAQAAEGLHAAHVATAEDGSSLGLIHRDVSPQNLLVGLDGMVRISDFGVAHAAERLTSTQTGQFKGKLDYCSPEQALGKRLDARSDLFSLGVVAWELLAKKRLFRGRTPFDTLDAVLHRDPPDLRLVRPDLPDAAALVIAAMLSRDPAARPAHAGEVAARLREAITPALEEPGTEPAQPLRELVTSVATPVVRRLAGLSASFDDETTDVRDLETVSDADLRVTVLDRPPKS